MSYMKVLSQHSNGVTEEKPRNPLSTQPVNWLRCGTLKYKLTVLPLFQSAQHIVYIFLITKYPNVGRSHPSILCCDNFRAQFPTGTWPVHCTFQLWWLLLFQLPQKKSYCFSIQSHTMLYWPQWYLDRILNFTRFSKYLVLCMILQVLVYC